MCREFAVSGKTNPGICLISGSANIPVKLCNHVAYLGFWLKEMKQDKRHIFHAAAAAQRVADYLLEFHPEWTPDRPHGSLDSQPDPPRPA